MCTMCCLEIRLRSSCLTTSTFNVPDISLTRWGFCFSPTHPAPTLLPHGWNCVYLGFLLCVCVDCLLLCTLHITYSYLGEFLNLFLLISGKLFISYYSSWAALGIVCYLQAHTHHNVFSFLISLLVAFDPLLWGESPNLYSYQQLYFHFKNHFTF